MSAVSLSRAPLIDCLLRSDVSDTIKGGATDSTTYKAFKPEPGFILRFGYLGGLQSEIPHTSPKVCSCPAEWENGADIWHPPVLSIKTIVLFLMFTNSSSVDFARQKESEREKTVRVGMSYYQSINAKCVLAVEEYRRVATEQEEMPEPRENEIRCSQNGKIGTYVDVGLTMLKVHMSSLSLVSVIDWSRSGKEKVDDCHCWERSNYQQGRYSSWDHKKTNARFITSIYTTGKRNNKGPVGPKGRKRYWQVKRKSS